MQAIEENVYYSPKFSNRATISLRRLSWYLKKKQMTRVINEIANILPTVFESSKVCKTCIEKAYANTVCFTTQTYQHKSHIAPALCRGISLQGVYYAITSI